MKAKRGIAWGLAMAVGVLLVLVARPAPLAAQGWFRTGTGLGVSKVRLALPDFASGNAATQPLAQVFNQVLWNDLNYSGVVDMASKSFYPLPSTWPSQPNQFQGQQQQWSQPPVNAAMISFGNLAASGTNLSLSAWLMDLTNPSAPPMLAKIYSGAATPEGARQLAHELADDIVSALTGGVPGIAQTQIAYSHQVGNVSELWVMDYDGANAHRITHLGTEAITPRWSPDASEIAFTCFVPYRGVVSAQVCLYSMAAKRVLYFRRFPGTNATPAWSPSGQKIAFMSSMRGSPEIWVASANGNDPKELTFTPNSVNTSPVWNPKTGQQIVFVSDRGGLPELYMMNSDGSNVVPIHLPDMGYVVDPTWSPNSQLIAFSWRRPNGNYDIYVMDIGSQQLLQLTHDAGRNERPWWAPDGRHLVFQSDRTGSWQIWTMLADGSDARQLTRGGKNFSPSWSPR
ncbi:MAG TPA: translocation protein TolB [Candidatus Dormibacteraeota bacterium]|nr:translocation protein TolB [Candidatus Dormibacteraeota bacterium]